jgi:hypothetical protein
MSKEQLPMELVERFESVISKIGLIPKTAEQCARIAIEYAKEEMEKEAVAFDKWKLKNGYQRFSDTQWISHRDEYFTPSDLYRIFKTQTEKV